MLLERIEVDSCGSLERVQLGPFHNRLNVVYGPAGSGKTAAIDFLRSVMLGTDRRWHAGSSGSIVWSDAEGLMHCRRDGDGTVEGRLSIDVVDRDGITRKYHHGYRDADNYHRLDRWVALPRTTIDAIVAPLRESSLRALLHACRAAGISTHSVIRDEAEISRVQTRLLELERQLSGYLDATTHRSDLEARRIQLLDEIAHLDRLDAAPPAHHGRRARLELRLNDCRDELARLRLQESDLRRSLAEVERELSQISTMRAPVDAALQIASVRRMQLEELDAQLGRLCRTLREIRTLHDGSSDAVSCSLVGEIDNYYEPSMQWVQTRGFYRSRLDAARRHLEWLVRNYDRSRVANTYADDTLVYNRVESGYLGRAELDSMIASLRSLIGELERMDHSTHRLNLHSDPLRQCESSLTHSISRLVAARTALLQQIAAEHGVSIEQLTAAFGDWCQCHDAPHLYEWLLSDRFPPRIQDSEVTVARRRRLERDQAEMLDELSRTVNRLDNQTSEIRTIEGHLHALPVSLPVVVDHRHRQSLRDELAQVERRLRWLDSRHPLDEERSQLTRRLDSLLQGSRHESPFWSRVSYWLDLLAAGHLSHLIPRDYQFGSDPQGDFASDYRATENPDGSLLTRSDSERQMVLLAIRMAAVEELQRKAVQVPLLIDEPTKGWGIEDGARRVASVLAQFASEGHQCILFTADPVFADRIRDLGGKWHALRPARYYQLRYREPQRTVPSSYLNSNHINRELDTAWREANGVYDDPHWYRPAREPSGYRTTYSAPSHVREYYVDAPQDVSNRVSRGPASPFFLTDHSPIDQSPSIDAVAAERLRSCGIHRVGQLLQADPVRVAARLQLADVTADVVNRWQNEATLVCGVPQLRNFDARVLVGCGFTSPRQLAAMHPGQLLDRVEAFLATERGRQILRSGTSYELSRITSWIAAANRSVAKTNRHGTTREHLRQTTDTSHAAQSAVRPAEPRAYSEPLSDEYRRERRKRRLRAIADAERELHRYQDPRAREQRTQQPRSLDSRSAASPRRAFSTSASPRQSAGSSSGRSSGSLPGRSSAAAMTSADPGASKRNVVSMAERDATRVLKFFLERQSPIVDAPSIGPKAAERLIAFGYHTVGDFLAANPGTIASQLNSRKITEELVRTWQQQATLVCRVPMLRGHDAQLLVEAGIQEAERLAQADPQWLFAKIDPISRSSEGKRILRGAKLPDLAEIKDWIQWAKDSRSLRAA